MERFSQFKLFDLAEKDIPEIMRITKENMSPVINTMCGLKWDLHFENKYLDKLLSSGTVKTIHYGSKLIGYIWFDERQEKNGIFINSIQLRKEWQGKGIGTQILKWLEIFALNYKRQYLSLSVQINNKRATSFYLRFGFFEVCRRHGSIYVIKFINRYATWAFWRHIF